MNKYLKAISVCIFLFASLESTAQVELQKKINKSHLLISPNLLIPLNQWGVNAEMAYITQNRWRPTVSMGLYYQDNNVGATFDKWLQKQRFGNSIQLIRVSTVWFIPITLGIGYALGKKKMSLIESNFVYRYADAYDPIDGFSSKAHQVALFVGYKLQPPRGGFTLKAGISLDLFGHANITSKTTGITRQDIIFYNIFNDFEKLLRFTTPFAPEVTIGWSFRVKKANVEDIE